jgi:transcriptional regulator with XRE-family HTH domain
MTKSGSVKKLALTNAAIGLIVRQARKDSKLNQTQICKALGLDQSAFSRVENGKQMLSAAQWVLFCQAVGRKDLLVACVDEVLERQ